jgi:polyhydroxybutyrate depolymerase
MRRVYIVVGLILLVTFGKMALSARRKAAGPGTATLPAIGCASLKTGDTELSWRAKEGLRPVLAHLPARADRSKPLPVVILLHGGGQKGGGKIAGPSRMNDTADANGFMVLYPRGGVPGKWGGYTWNGGDCCGEAMTRKMDDVGSIAALIDTLTSGGCVDPKRVYVTGVSNGGIMSYRLACDLSDRIAAAAPIAGALMDTTCTPSRPVSIYAMHGTADEFLNYEGGENWKKSGAARPFVSVRQSIGAWLKLDGCKGEPKQTYSKGDTTCITNDQCDGGSAVTLCTIEGGGHTWPGGEPKMQFLIGKTTQDITNQHMWDFFAAHPMK